MTTPVGGQTRSREPLDDNVDLERDRELVTRAQDGDRSAFDELYLRYYRRLYRFCFRRLRDAFEAEDVTQEAFSRAWRALGSFDGARSFYPWLSVIAANLCTDVFRKCNRSTPVAEFHQKNIASTDDSGEEMALRAVDSEMVVRAFERLSERHKRILRLREGSEWSYQKIADHEGMATTAVETLLWRARQALKREFVMIARAEGRIAALIGGALSIAALRRLLRRPGNALRRVGSLGHGGGTIAAGSAAAATAMIMASALSGPAVSVAAQASGPGAISSEMTSGFGILPLGGPGDGAPPGASGAAGDVGRGQPVTAPANSSTQSNGNEGGSASGGVGLGGDLVPAQIGVAGAGAVGDLANGNLAIGPLGGVTSVVTEAASAVTKAVTGAVSGVVPGGLTGAVSGAANAAVGGALPGTLGGVLGTGTQPPSGSAGGSSTGQPASEPSSLVQGVTGGLGGLLGATLPAGGTTSSGGSGTQASGSESGSAASGSGSSLLGGVLGP